jgi:hypothetical protein
MLKILSAKATETSKSFKALPRRKGEDNLAWMTRAKLSATGVYLLLVGGRDRTFGTISRRVTGRMSCC